MGKGRGGGRFRSARHERRQRHGALTGIADCAAGGLTGAARARPPDQDRKSGVGGARQVGCHRPRARGHAAGGGRTRSEPPLPFHPAQVGIDRHRVIGRRADKCQSPEPPVSDHQVEQHGWGQRALGGRWVNDLELPQQLKSGSLQGGGGDLALRPHPGRALRVVPTRRPVLGTCAVGPRPSQGDAGAHHHGHQGRGSHGPTPKQYTVPSNVPR